MHPKDTIPYGYCQCGCGQKTTIANKTDTRRGWVNGQPIRYIVGHYVRTIHIPVENRYHEEDRGHPTPCWIWDGIKKPDGYGTAYDKDSQTKGVSAHRLFYKKYKGEIPEGLQIDHLCRVRCCVNPDHLEPVTPEENSRRGSCSKLTLAQAREIRAIGCSQSCQSVADRFKVSKSTISAIRRHKLWKE